MFFLNAQNSENFMQEEVARNDRVFSTDNRGNVSFLKNMIVSPFVLTDP